MSHIRFLIHLAIATSTSAVLAQAGPAETPQSMFRQGENEYAAGRYEVAIELWERAYAMDPRPGLQYNLAQAYGRTGMIVEERRALELFLERLADTEPEAINGSEASSARARIAAIDARLARTAIELRGVPRHALVTIDGERIEHSNGRHPVSAGSHAIRVELPGFVPFTTTVTVVAAAVAQVDVELQVAPVEEANDASRTPPAIVAEEEGPSPLPLTLLISGGVLVAGGSALGGLAVHYSRGTFRDTSDAERSRRFGIGADVTLGVGAALAVTGLVLVLVRDDEEEAPAPTVAVGMTGSSVGTVMPAMEVTW